MISLQQRRLKPVIADVAHGDMLIFSMETKLAIVYELFRTNRAVVPIFVMSVLYVEYQVFFSVELLRTLIAVHRHKGMMVFHMIT